MIRVIVGFHSPWASKFRVSVLALRVSQHSGTVWTLEIRRKSEGEDRGPCSGV